MPYATDELTLGSRANITIVVGMPRLAIKPIIHKMRIIGEVSPKPQHKIAVVDTTT